MSMQMPFSMPTPMSKPIRLSALAGFVLLLAASCAPKGEPDRTQPSAPVQTAAQAKEARQCLAELDQTGSPYRNLPDRYFGAGCQRVNGVQLDAVRGDDAQFALTNLGPMTCPLAAKFIGWARFGVDRAAREILDSPLERIETFGSYSCRNVAGTARRSAHSRAEAVDVAAFVLADGRRISVKTGWNEGTREERRFLRTIQQSACKRFGTVLGPEYNAAHEDHFHLELRGGSFCR